MIGSQPAYRLVGFLLIFTIFGRLSVTGVVTGR